MNPNFGDRVIAVPAGDLRVQVSGVYGRFLSAEGEEVIWDHWYQARLLDGSLSIRIPAPPAKAAPAGK